MRSKTLIPTASLTAALDALAAQDVTARSTADIRSDLRALLAATNRLHAELVRRIAQFDAVSGCAADGFRSTRAWLRAFGRLSNTCAARLVRAVRLLHDLPDMAAATAAGEVTPEHLRRLDLLVERIGIEPVREADKALTEVATEGDPAAFDKACTRVRRDAQSDGPRPDAAGDFDRRGMTVSRLDGMLTLRGQLDPEGGAALQSALDSLMKPTGPADDRLAPQRRADALVELARGALRAGRLPEVGGQRPQIGVLVTPQNLLGGRPAPLPADRTARVLSLVAARGRPFRTAGARVAAGIGRTPPASWLGWLGDVPDEVAQRIACDGDVWRIVLDPASNQPLDLGRTHQVVPGWVRKALQVRDNGCVFPGCDAPSACTDVHYLLSWARGGRTELANLVVLCRHHHSLMHEGGWKIDRDPASGVVTVWRPGGRRFLIPRDEVA
jgi:hypothetical protein